MPSWWRDAVFYEVYVRSFADASGDGTGDLEGIRGRLPYLRDLGVDALWLTPFYPSPMADHGYDVADPRGVDPLFGSLADVDRLLADASALDLKVIVDLVPNHVSSEHPWFRAALAAGPASPERDRFSFRPGGGPGGDAPPNNWTSPFGGRAWTRVPDGEWYLHLFTPEQPDLNWRHPEVAEDFDRTLRFWLDRGVAGFRVDVAHGLVKDEQLRDNPGEFVWGMPGHGHETRYSYDQPEVHDVYRRWRRILDSYAGRTSVGEVYLADPAALARYVRPDELHLAFNFHLLWAPWDAAALRAAVEESLATNAGVHAVTSWVLSSHDAVRHRTRYGEGEGGLRRARAAALLLLALPGVAFVYQGEELGLPEAYVPDEAIQDPLYERSARTERGRDGCRIPLPWEGDAPPYGFCPPDVPPWLPMPADWAGLTVAAQDRDPGSVLWLYREALRLRRGEPGLGGGRLAWQGAGPDELVFTRTADEGAGRGRVVCAVNLGAAPVRRPAGEVLLASDDSVGDQLPPDTAVWVRPAGG
jgi:alpha-glucosidase